MWGCSECSSGSRGEGVTICWWLPPHGWQIQRGRLGHCRSLDNKTSCKVISCLHTKNRSNLKKDSVVLKAIKYYILCYASENSVAWLNVYCLSGLTGAGFLSEKWELNQWAWDMLVDTWAFFLKQAHGALTIFQWCLFFFFLSIASVENCTNVLQCHTNVAAYH